MDPNETQETLLTERISIPSVHDNKLLETRVSYLNHVGALKAVIISHPYGPLGGNFNNNVVVAIEEFFLGKDYLTLAFNFRGVGKSEGRTSWTGAPECDDYRTMVDFLANRGTVSGKQLLQIPPVSEIIIVGYSYGSLIATSLSSYTTSVPLSFVIISYPYSVIWFLTFFCTSQYLTCFGDLVSSDERILFVYGDSDQFTGVRKYRRLVEDCHLSEKPNWTVRELDDIDHFWYGTGMEAALIGVLDEWLNACQKTKQTVNSIISS
ncbi:9290_t:CDS:2 [Paraglomus brasilianum]|uniref:9290_t:CDS:1 n=1 Tax=Paraglomus brasilianum TaxID=144538 RepID=A0A9N8VNH7_9GLOM|nr:9290_t:CDS:2 [Paraglomus brasilianum]